MDEQVGAVTEVAPEVGSRSGGGRSRARAVVGVVAVAAVVAGGAAVLSQRGGEAATGRERLVDLKAFVGDHASYSYTIDSSGTFSSGDGGSGAGASATLRSHTTVEVLGEDLWHVTADAGEWASELLRVSDDGWERFANSADELDAEPWTAFDISLLDEEIATEANSADMLGLDAPEDLGWTPEDIEAFEALTQAVAFTSDPAGTVEMISGAVDAEVVRVDGEGSTLRLTPDGAPKGDAEGDAADDDAAAVVTIEADLDPDGVPTALRVVSRSGSMSIDVAVRFTDWDFDGQLVAPDAGSVDATPLLDEEGVAAYSGPTVYVPSELPDGWELYAVELISAEDSFEGCEQLMIGFGPALEEGGDPTLLGTEQYLDVYVLDIDCALEADPTPFQESADGRLTRYGDTELRIGGSLVQLDTSLGGDALDAAIASLVETDPKTLIAD